MSFFLRIAVIAICFFLKLTSIFAQGIIPEFTKKTTDVIIDSVKLAKDTSTKAKTDTTILIEVRIPPEKKVLKNDTCIVDDSRGGTLVTGKDDKGIDTGYYTISRTTFVFAPGAEAIQSIQVIIKKKAKSNGTIILNLLDADGKFIANHTIKIGRPKEKDPFNIFKTLFVSIGGNVDLKANDSKLNGLYTDIRLYAPEAFEAKINFTVHELFSNLPGFNYLDSIKGFSQYYKSITDLLGFRFSGFGFEAGAYSSRVNLSADSIYNQPYSAVYPATLPSAISDSIKYIVEKGTYTLKPTIDVLSLFFSPYLQVFDYKDASTDAIINRISISYTPRFEFISRTFTYTPTNVTPIFKKQDSIFNNPPIINFPASEQIVKYHENYVALLGFTLHAVLEKSLDFHIGIILGGVTVVRSPLSSSHFWSLTIPAFFVEKEHGLVISVEVRDSYNDFPFNPSHYTPATLSYFSVNIAKQFSLQKFADIIFGSGS